MLKKRSAWGRVISNIEPATGVFLKEKYYPSSKLKWQVTGWASPWELPGQMEQSNNALSKRLLCSQQFRKTLSFNTMSWKRTKEFGFRLFSSFPTEMLKPQTPLPSNQQDLEADVKITHPLNCVGWGFGYAN